MGHLLIVRELRKCTSPSTGMAAQWHNDTQAEIPGKQLFSPLLSLFSVSSFSSSKKTWIHAD